jgi:predicted ATPase
MLKRLHLRNFTVFADAEFEFGEGLNVLVGANGTGKTHVLKAGYSVSSALLRGVKIGDVYEMEGVMHVRVLERAVKNMRNVFQLPLLQTSELIKRQIGDGEALICVEVINTEYKAEVALSLVGNLSKASSTILSKEKNAFTLIAVEPVFIPAKEVLTMGWLLSLYARREIPIDETYPDLLRLLSGPSLRQPQPAHIVEKLAQLIGGKVEEEGGHFYLAAENQPRLEMNLVAEGMRKFATLYKLLANGTLTPETTLFWDEPEANLNPALLKELAAILTDLAQAGFQIILATHSLFLMRELHILAQRKKKPVRYFGLYKSEEGDVRVERQDDLMQLQHLVALDAELAQTFDFEAALDEDYAGDN